MADSDCVLTVEIISSLLARRDKSRHNVPARGAPGPRERAEAIMTISREAGLRVVDEALAAVHAPGERGYEAELYRLKEELVRMQSPAQAKAETCLH